MKIKSPEPLARVGIGNPMRRHNRQWDIHVDGGLLRAEEVGNGLLWKLDELHEALILQVLREKKKALNARIKTSIALGKQDQLAELNEARDRINEAMTAVGNRKV